MEKTAAADEVLYCDVPEPRGIDRRHRILVAEDNPINQEVIAASLTRLGHSFHVVDNGAAAVAAFDEEPFGLVLMDCRMPTMDGFEATRAIRQREDERKNGIRIPILAISANATQADRQLCLASGMDDHIAKPFTLTQLKQKLEKWIAATERPIHEGATRPVVTATEGPTFHLLHAETLRAFDDLQMPDQPSIIDELIDSFYRTAPQQLHLIGSLLRESDLKGSMTAAHGMKSASAAIGLTALSNAFRSIETCVGAKDRDGALLAAQKTGYVLNRSLHELSMFKAHFDRLESRDITFGVKI
jgi:CheY-like chemotaxis protein/HPt (histidine-containing phosphotransfer) domain-containing protein